MKQNNVLSPWRDKALFTPGPLTTSRTVKQSMLSDLGSRDTTFIETVRDIRSRLVALGNVTESDYTAILMQGSGTFGIEAVVSSVLPTDGKLLIIVNGAYGERILKIANVHKIETVTLRSSEDTYPDPLDLEILLSKDSTITHIAVVHCETTTGIINPIEKYGEIVHEHNRIYFVDAMSSFGAYPIDLNASKIDYLVSSANKDIEGVPGFSFILARKEVFALTKGYARTLSLDLYAQWEGLESNGQFRFTPPTHAILAFSQALKELEDEGGVHGRAMRYKRNFDITFESMQKMGFRPFLKTEDQGFIITSFHYPAHPNFNFQQFYQKLSDKGYVIYPGKLSQTDCFRIGHIGRLEAGDVQALMAAIKEVLIEMEITLTSIKE